jgi:hypothetical protein
MLCDPFLGFGGRPVIDGHVMSGLGQMAGNRATHHTQTDKSYSTHGAALEQDNIKGNRHPELVSG